MKPLLMMRTNGMTGPYLSKHAGVKGLSKSSGSFIGLDVEPPEPVVKQRLNFDIPRDTYGELVTPWVASTQFTVQCVFSTTETQNQFLVVDDAGDSRLIIDTNGTRFFFVYGGAGFHYFTPVGAIIDGETHTITVTVDTIARTIDWNFDGETEQDIAEAEYPAPSYTYMPHTWQGIFYKVTLKDNITPSNTRTYTINSGRTDYEEEDSSTSASLRLNYIGVLPGDWEVYE